MSSTPTYAITTVCRLTGLSSRTLRRWERLGLLVPAEVDGRGRRHYDQADLGVVLHLLLLRSLGFPTPQRTTWRPGPPPPPVLETAADMVAEQARRAPELCRQLRRDVRDDDAQGVLHLIGLLVRWGQPSHRWDR